MDTQTISQLIVAVSRGLVDEKDAVNVTVDEPAEDGTVVFHLHVAADVIGKQGRIAKAIRTVVRAAANKAGMKAAVEID